jgi:antitoxin (DNA-binding transcriptional repressor) of toxin-antitoxin stability system
METVSATDLKNRLGEVLAKARLHPVAIERHGKVVALLTPVPTDPAPTRSRVDQRRPQMPRDQEERLVDLCASGDLRPSRWLRAGDPRLLAGVAVMLASQPEFDRYRLLALAERLEPGMSRPENFGRWLQESPLRAARFLPMVRAQMRALRK